MLQSPPKNRKTVATGFIASVLLILVIGQGALWVWFLYTQKVDRLDLLTEKMQMAGGLLSSFSAVAVSEGDTEALQKIIDEMSAIEDITSITILDADGRTIYKSGSEPKADRGLIKSFLPFFAHSHGKLSYPLKHDGRDVGGIEIVYDTKEVNDEMTRLLTVPPLMQLLVFLLVIQAIYYFFQRKIGRPINALQDSMEKATTGDLTVKIPKTGEGEINVIAEGLRFLVENLSANISRLTSTADNVAVAIRQLNITFRNVMEIVKKQSSSMHDMAGALNKANESQKNIADGTIELSKASSENVSLIQQVRGTAAEILGSTNRLFQASDDSYSTVAEMAQTSKVMSEHSRSVLSSVDDVHRALGSIVDTVTEVQKSAKDSASLASDVREIAAVKGVFAITDVIEGMEKIAERVTYSAEIVRQLGARSKDIQKMLSVIKEVTEQTNLLSLNAAILAQQAGEYGKGFSVVADEMRQLSDRTSASTKEIAGIIRKIQDEISEAVSSIEGGMGLAKEGIALVNRAGESMGSIVVAARESASMAVSIEKATERQAQELKQIAVSMNSIRTMASRMSHAMEEQMRGSGYMLERVREVKEIAESTKKGAEEQAAGMNVMSKNIEQANERIASINRAALNQQSVNDGIITSVEQIRSVGISIQKDVEAVSLSLKELQEEISVLKEEVETFKVK